ncbi:uncharacterized protein LOC129607350 isoform X2 [Condylostylus longicornis]|nr:uncharacterized protein LOC129607350 isoform X2 [Condylostylus longicornis]
MIYHSSGKANDSEVEKENAFNVTDVISQPSFRFPPFSLRNGTNIYSRPGVLVSSWLPAYFPLPLFLHDQQIFNKSIDEDIVNKIEEGESDEDLNKFREIANQSILKELVGITSQNILSESVEPSDQLISDKTVDLQKNFNETKSVIDQPIFDKTRNIPNQTIEDKSTVITKLHLITKSGKSVDMNQFTANESRIDKSIKITKLYLINKTEAIHEEERNPKF